MSSNDYPNSAGSPAEPQPDRPGAAEPSGTPSYQPGYRPPGQGYQPAQPGQGYQPAQPEQGYQPAQPGQGYQPATASYPPVAPAYSGYQHAGYQPGSGYQQAGGYQQGSGYGGWPPGY